MYDEEGQRIDLGKDSVTLATDENTSKALQAAEASWNNNLQVIGGDGTYLLTLTEDGDNTILAVEKKPTLYPHTITM